MPSNDRGVKADLDPARGSVPQTSEQPVNDTGHAVLSLDDVSVSFGGVAALSGMTFSVAKNDVAAIVGPNGAGKTTVLNAVNGLIRRNCEGSIRILGQEVSGFSAPKIAKFGVGRSFQHPHMIESATVLENVMCGTYLRYPYTMFDQFFRRRFVARAERAAHEQSLRALDLVGLSALKTARVDSLPYGARKLVDIARALASEPTLLLLDEPSSGLDNRERGSVLDVLIQLRDQKQTTVLVVEHHMDLVRRSATVVIGVQAGSVIRTGAPGEVLDSDDFREAVIGHSHAAASNREDDEE